MQWWGMVVHRNQDLRMRGDPETDDSRIRARETTIGLREEGSRIIEVRACRLKENSRLRNSYIKLLVYRVGTVGIR